VEELILLQQNLNPSRSRFARPYDSTAGVGVGFYRVAGLIILLIIMGALKAYWDDKEWKGSSYRFRGRESNQSRKK
jgi:hypothetical protein